MSTSVARCALTAVGLLTVLVGAADCSRHPLQADASAGASGSGAAGASTGAGGGATGGSRDGGSTSGVGGAERGGAGGGAGATGGGAGATGGGAAGKGGLGGSAGAVGGSGGSGCPPCAANEICREIVGSGPGASQFTCVANSCGAGPITCTCADSACRDGWGPGVPPHCTAIGTDGADVVCTGGGQCASPDTPVATPFGPKPIASLAVGDLVWSLTDRAIEAVPIRLTSRTPVVGHHVIRLELEGGTTIEVSARHPLGDGRDLGSLVVGDRIDGRLVVSREVVPYRFPFTFDILPASDTGTYFVGGLLVGSTLAPPVR